MKVKMEHRNLGKFLVTMLAVSFCVALVPPVLAVNPGHSEIDRYTNVDNAWGLYGNALLFETNWENNIFQTANFWTALALAGEQGPNVNLAEVNLNAQWSWYAWHMYVGFSWRDNRNEGTSQPVDIGVRWGTNIGIKIEKFASNVYKAYYKLPGGSWQLIDSHTYSSSWEADRQYSTFECNFPAKQQGSAHMISAFNSINIKYTYGGNYQTWPNTGYTDSGNTIQYNIIQYYAYPGLWATRCRS